MRRRSRSSPEFIRTHQPSEPGFELFAIGTCVSEPSSLFRSLLGQIGEIRNERKRPRIHTTAAEVDPSALKQLIEYPSPFLSLLSQLRELRNESRHPKKLKITATPSKLKEIWSKPSTGLPRLISASLHALLIGLALFPWAPSLAKRLQPNETVVTLYTPARSKLILNPLEAEGRSAGGGGGGKRQPTPASFGQLPRASDKQFVPPSPEPLKSPDPKLVVEPTIVAPQLAQLPQISLLNIGDPFAVSGPPSSGPGTGGGIGSGQGRGVGEGRGPGVGPGEGGGVGGGEFSDGVFRIGSSGVTSPTVIYRVEPQYSEEARRARFQGTVVLQAIVRRDGTIDILRVVRSLGFGLDENAITALKQWRFKPGTMEGQAVDVSLNVEVNFNLR
jgi:periplasmic protein TonB